MKKTGYFLVALLLIFSGSCKKYTQQQEQNALVSLITNGVWVVTRYVDNGTDITSTFSGYVFQFQSNGTVIGTKAMISTPGTWSGDLNARTITSNFPSVGDPLDKLNTVWKITDSYPDSVAATGVINANTNILNLHKQ